MKKAKIWIFSLLLTNSSLLAIDEQLSKQRLDLSQTSKGVAEIVGEFMQDTWDDSEPLREAIGEKSRELWDDSAPLREDLEEKIKDGWNIAEEWSTQKYDELKQSKENPDNSSSWLNFSDSVKKMRMNQQPEVHSKNYDRRRSPVQNN